MSASHFSRHNVSIDRARVDSEHSGKTRAMATRDRELASNRELDGVLLLNRRELVEMLTQQPLYKS
jgi:hypothetical protein